MIDESMLNSPCSLDITFYVPALNEERDVAGALATLVRAAERANVSYEILVFDDGSTDRTTEVVEGFFASHPGVEHRLVKRPNRMGLARNFVDGAFIGKGRYYKLVGGDDSETEESVVAILSHLGEADIVLPYLRDDIRAPFRRSLSCLFTAVVNLVGGHRIRYYNGTGAHRRYNIMRWHSDTYGFAYQAELVTRLLDEGATVVEVPVDNIEREGRRSSALTPLNMMSVAHSLLQIFLRRLRRWMFNV